MVVRFPAHGIDFLLSYRDAPHAGQSGDRIPVGARFCARVQPGPVAHTAFYTVDTGSFPGVKQGVALTTHPI